MLEWTMDEFEQEVEERVAAMPSEKALVDSAASFMSASTIPKYCYNFAWLGRPIIQYPQDIVAMQEIIHAVRPDLIIETGIAHGGSLIFNASMLAMLDMNDAIESGEAFDPSISRRKVLGVDIDIRAHNRSAIDAHPMRSRIEMIQGSSIDTDVVKRVVEYASHYDRVLVSLDSNHTHAHVLAELEAYAPLTSVGSYCVVFDTVVEDLPADFFPDRPWGPGDNPKTAVREFLEDHKEFAVDYAVDNKLLISVAPEGYLKRVG
jgi:cephalosporin hydroxylase